MAFIFHILVALVLATTAAISTDVAVQHMKKAAEILTDSAGLN